MRAEEIEALVCKRDHSILGVYADFKRLRESPLSGSANPTIDGQSPA